VSTLPVIAVVGRPNVGKSALFNRLVGSRIAVVEDTPGTTRDRIYGEFEWRDRRYVLMDTGGFDESGQIAYSPQVRTQVKEALRQADLILFLVDAAVGVTAADEEVADLLRRSEKTVLLVANKADSESRELNAVDFYSLGIGEPIAVSAYHGLGIADLLEKIEEKIPGDIEIAVHSNTEIAVAIVGRPNVGKSAILNAILGEERVIVSEVPGTTRDAIDTRLTFDDHDLRLIDTAGIRRRGKVMPGVEKHSVMRSESAIDRCDVSLVVVDASDPLTAQDVHIAGYVAKAGKGLVMTFNKWDLVPDHQEAAIRLNRLARFKLKFAPWAEVAFTSAVRKQGVSRMLQLAISCALERRRRVQTSELNAVVRKALLRHSPPSTGRRQLKVLYATQADIEPPTFIFFVNDPALAHFSLRRYLENQLREAFAFKGTAIRVIFRGRGQDGS
jgi:GTPase